MATNRASSGSGASSGLIGVVPLARDREQIATTEVRLEGTTSLATYLVMLLVGIRVSMAIWWNRQRQTQHGS